MKKLIVANWKMNPASLPQAKKLFQDTAKAARSGKCETIICPPSPFLSSLSSRSVRLGAQDVSFYENTGAHTGETSAIILKKLGVSHVIIGHSERRAAGETSEIAARKTDAALANGLTAILCVGERAEERGDANTAARFVERELEESLRTVLHHPSFLSRCVIAYEPIWAIGTGVACTSADASRMARIIREFVASHVPPVAAKRKPLRVLYGGSVTKENAGNFLASPDIDGLLVGGASLKAAEFARIVAAVK